MLIRFLDKRNLTLISGKLSYDYFDEKGLKGLRANVRTMNDEFILVIAIYVIYCVYIFV